SAGGVAPDSRTGPLWSAGGAQRELRHAALRRTVVLNLPSPPPKTTGLAVQKRRPDRALRVRTRTEPDPPACPRRLLPALPRPIRSNRRTIPQQPCGPLPS